MRDLKRHTSKTLLEVIKNNPIESRREWMMWMFEREGKRNPNNEHYQFWQQNNKPIELSDAAMTRQKLNYIHDNPVEAGFVENPWEYLYSSARNYQTEEKGLLDIMFLY